MTLAIIEYKRVRLWHTWKQLTKSRYSSVLSSWSRSLLSRSSKYLWICFFICLKLNRLSYFKLFFIRMRKTLKTTMNRTTHYKVIHKRSHMPGVLKCMYCMCVCVNITTPVLQKEFRQHRAHHRTLVNTFQKWGELSGLVNISCNVHRHVNINIIKIKNHSF